MANKSALVSKFVNSVWESFRANSGLEPRLLDGLRVTDATRGAVNFELSVQKEHTNRLGILHGGTIASMGKATYIKQILLSLPLPQTLTLSIIAVDLGGSLAVASKGLFSTGVSTDLNVTYISSGGRIGDKILAKATCDKFGKTLAFTSISFFNEREELVARGSHTKYVAQAWKDENNIVAQLSLRE